MLMSHSKQNKQWSSEKTEKGHNRKTPNFCCSRKMLTFLDSTKRVKVTQENANKKEMSGLDWLITLRRISFDRSKIQRKCMPIFTENIWELT